MQLGVWAGKAQLRDPQRWADRIAESGCKRVDIIVNDLSRWRVRKSGKVSNGWRRVSRHFETYDTDKLEAFAKACHDVDLSVNTLFWAVPTRKGFINAACWLHTFADVVGVDSHVLDAEEPITRSSYVDYGDDPERAAEHLASMLTRPLGVTHIGYAPVETVRPFVRRAQYAIPQTYLTKTSGLTPDSIPRLIERAKTKLGAKAIVGAYAMYRQPRPSNIAATIEALQACGVERAVGWHAAGLRKYAKELQKVVA